MQVKHNLDLPRPSISDSKKYSDLIPSNSGKVFKVVVLLVI